MASRMLSGIHDFVRDRWAYCAASWLCAVWLIVVWGGGGFRVSAIVAIPTAWPLLVLVMLLVALPCAPEFFAIAVAACCVAYMVVPYAGPDVNWLNSAPMWLALVVLGYRWKSLKLAVIVLVIGCVPECIGIASGNELALSIAPSVQGCAMWWCVGALFGTLSKAAGERAAARERTEQYARRLYVLHVLHDSLANGLVYAILRCRAIASHDADGDAMRAGFGEIEEILKQSLTQLRQEIITPERSALGAAEVKGEKALVVEGESAAGESLSATISPILDELSQRMASQGWVGEAHMSGDCRHVSAECVRLVEACVRELGANMLKYGAPGAYALEVGASGNHVDVYSSNPVDSNPVDTRVNDSTDGPSDLSGGNSSAFTSECGLTLLRREIETVGGSLECAQENGEWSVCIAIPCRNIPRRN